MRRRFMTSCLTKAAYKTYMEGESARMRKQKEYGKNLSLYLCRFCRDWHLTSHIR